MYHHSYVLSLVFLGVFGRGYSDDAIAQGVARIALLSQGYDAGAILEPGDVATVRSTQTVFEGYYEGYDYNVTNTVPTTSGPVRGAKFAESYAFYSIPYAMPPVRYQPPVPYTGNDEEIDASIPDGLVCEQLRKNCSNGVCIFNTNEDCLVLNIHVPSSVEFNDTMATSSGRPVFVWFHGGGFFGGGGTIPEFEARWMSNTTNAVIVTVNYRLGAFGFLVHGEGDDAIRGNQGLKDQQLALTWVQDNIERFGGDPNMVTIFGNSAGAQSVMFHLVSKVSKPLFQRAIMESNPAVFQYHTIEGAKRVTDRLLYTLNCSRESQEVERQCLLEADPRSINIALLAVMPLSLLQDKDIFTTVEAFRPVVDGEEFPQQPFEMFRDGTWNTDKDVIIGTNTNELEVIQYYIPDKTPDGKPIPFPKTFFEGINNFLFGNETGKLVSEKYIDAFGEGVKSDYEVILGIEASHMFFVCPSRLMARYASNTSDTGRVFLYSNSHPMDGPTCPNVVSPPQMCGLSFHGSEPPFVFRTGPFYGYDFRDVDTSAADQFDYYWTNFAVNGDPSNSQMPSGFGHDFGPFTDWPRYSYEVATRRRRSLTHGRLINAGRSSLGHTREAANGTWQNIQIGQENVVQEKYMEDFCDFWDSLNYYVDLHTGATELPTETDPPLASTTSGAATIAQNWSFASLLLLLVAKFILGAE